MGRYVREMQLMRTSLANFSVYTDKHCGPGSDCSLENSLIWVHTVCYKDLSGIKLASNINGVSLACQ